jgi:hypothetical protein
MNDKITRRFKVLRLMGYKGSTKNSVLKHCSDLYSIHSIDVFEDNNILTSKLQSYELEFLRDFLSSNCPVKDIRVNVTGKGQIRNPKYLLEKIEGKLLGLKIKLAIKLNQEKRGSDRNLYFNSLSRKLEDLEKYINKNINSAEEREESYKMILDKFNKEELQDANPNI